jgi:hypothetical protein
MSDPVFYHHSMSDGLHLLAVVFQGWDVLRVTDSTVSEEVLGVTLMNVSEVSEAALSTANTVRLGGLYYRARGERRPLTSKQDWFFRFIATGQSTLP